MNLPAGVTQRDITALCPPSDNDYPNWQECHLCRREIVQDSDTRRWFLADDVDGIGMNYCLKFADSLDARETQQGWTCSSDCRDENTVDAVVVEIGGAA